MTEREIDALAIAILLLALIALAVGYANGMADAAVRQAMQA